MLKATPTPSQFTLESKFLRGQPLYRFQLDSEGDFLIDLRPGHLHLMSLKRSSMWNIRRRPLLPCTLPYVLQFVFLSVSVTEVETSFAFKLPKFDKIFISSFYTTIFQRTVLIQNPLSKLLPVKELN